MNVFCNLGIAKATVSQKVLSLFRRFFTLWVDMYPYKVGGKLRKWGRKGGRLLRLPAIAIARGERNAVEHLKFKNEGVDFGEVKTCVKHEL